MDWLDRLSIWAIVLLVISSSALIAGHVGEAKPERGLQQRATVPDRAASAGEVEGKVKLARNLIESDSLDKAETLCRELVQKYPYEGEPRMLMGDLYLRRQDAVKAILEYKEAIDLNPDYLDRKTASFQGKKLKKTAAEALAEIEKKVRLNPGDEDMKRAKKNIYYLQRKIAGSCS